MRASEPQRLGQADVLLASNLHGRHARDGSAKKRPGRQRPQQHQQEIDAVPKTRLGIEQKRHRPQELHERLHQNRQFLGD